MLKTGVCRAQLPSREGMIAQPCHQGQEQLMVHAGPVGHCAVAEFDAFASVDGRLPMQKGMVLRTC
ncbi:hypothetical protein CAL29_02825 [Bordetella genomosp. 10]|uniref:Uncharacterized protein n=1 Tax=Bordetella genomosp. 10 TaxID=1416804 RepID=A0A261SIV9_9BORD|nr:hypothetical protein CAL29_02825 [Bordetella genomosp. 10]